MQRVVVVTGGAAGIGLASARRFAALGERVVILDRDPTAATAAAATLGDAEAVACDVADERRVAAAIAGIRERHGRIDVLVNNAGIVGDHAPALTGALAAARSILAVNLTGAFAVAQAAAGAMAATGGGAIVNVASLAGTVAVPGRTVYGAGKAALIGLTRALARDWAGRGIRVNAVLPGYVATEIVAKLLTAGKADLARIEQRIPLGRLAEPDEIAAAIVHLADAAGPTGATLAVDGGFGAYGGTGPASPGGGMRAALPATGRIVIVVGTGAAAAATAQQFAANGDHACLIDDHMAAAPAVASADILIYHVAGTDDAAGDASVEHFRAWVERGLIHPLGLAQAAAPAMIARGGGAIVIVTPPGVMAAGSAQLVRSLACEWAGHGVRVNAVCAGPAAVTDAAIAFLASPAASYVTGIVHPAGASASAF